VQRYSAVIPLNRIPSPSTWRITGVRLDANWLELHFGFEDVRVNAVLLYRPQSIIPAADKRKTRFVRQRKNP